MNEKPDLPEGWSMPPAMAKRVSESVNKKPVPSEDKGQKALDEMARDIALIESNRLEWGECLSSDHLANFVITSSPPQSTSAHHRRSI